MAQKAKSPASPGTYSRLCYRCRQECFQAVGSVFSEKDLYGESSCLNYISALGKMVPSVPLQGQLWGNICYPSLSLANRKSD